MMPDYTINEVTQTITLHKPMTMDELCRQLIADGRGVLAEAMTPEANEVLHELMRDGGWNERD
jgi:hypothetical protein